MSLSKRLINTGGGGSLGADGSILIVPTELKSGGDGHFHISYDYGATFVQSEISNIDTNASSAGGQCFISSTGQNIILQGASQSTKISTDYGQTFTSLGSPIGTNRVKTLEASDDMQYIWIYGYSSSYWDMYKSNDFGATFSNSGYSDFNNMFMSIDKTGQYIWLIDPSLLKSSTNYGVTFSNVAGAGNDISASNYGGLNWNYMDGTVFRVRYGASSTYLFYTYNTRNKSVVNGANADGSGFMFALWGTTAGIDITQPNVIPSIGNFTTIDINGSGQIFDEALLSGTGEVIYALSYNNLSYVSKNYGSTWTSFTLPVGVSGSIKTNRLS